MRETARHISAATKTKQIDAITWLPNADDRCIAIADVALARLPASARIFRTIVVYDDFCRENDPYEEHDFGAFEAEGHTIFFKIDYFDPTLTYHSDDPADSTVTHRVITIMLAEEY